MKPEEKDTVRPTATTLDDPRRVPVESGPAVAHVNAPHPHSPASKGGTVPEWGDRFERYDANPRNAVLQLVHTLKRQLDDAERHFKEWDGDPMMRDVAAGYDRERGALKEAIRLLEGHAPCPSLPSDGVEKCAEEIRNEVCNFSDFDALPQILAILRHHLVRPTEKQEGAS